MDILWISYGYSMTFIWISRWMLDDIYGCSTWGGKYVYINIIYKLLLPFSPYRFFLPYRFTGFRHSIIIKQTWRGSCTCSSHWENYFGSDLLNTIEDMVSLLGGISMAEWSVGDGIWSWFSGRFCYRFCYRFVIVLCHVSSPNPWSVGHTTTSSVHTNARGPSAAAF